MCKSSVGTNSRGGGGGGGAEAHVECDPATAGGCDPGDADLQVSHGRSALKKFTVETALLPQRPQ